MPRINAVTVTNRVGRYRAKEEQSHGFGRRLPTQAVGFRDLCKIKPAKVSSILRCLSVLAIAVPVGKPLKVMGRFGEACGRITPVTGTQRPVAFGQSAKVGGVCMAVARQG